MLLLVLQVVQQQCLVYDAVVSTLIVTLFYFDLLIRVQESVSYNQDVSRSASRGVRIMAN